jgi:hypothetical protein
MQVGIGKRQNNQSIVTEENAMTTESAAKLNLVESSIVEKIRMPYFPSAGCAHPPT